MGFFERLAAAAAEPEPTPARLPTPVWMRPDDVLPGSVGIELLLAHNDQGAVAVSELRAFPAGFAFTVVAVLREENQLIHRFDTWGGRELRDEFLRLGVQFADGTAASNVGGRIPPFDESRPDGPVLLPDSGGGGVRRYELKYWVWPLPPDGPVTFVCEWPAVGIGESTATIDAAVIQSAAARAVLLWPEDLPEVHDGQLA
ncbi:hypothetical protein O7635_31120 [Asanoa sp. WMMD1127]|uniref:hypothetical protein n=1 Tax=Asanoa sp. WMMD1127 TaxID=3016107 RepID=UPI0024161013|nr:hypothetical protein [Asanoa sp. WMMD1127]MDG4826324.1 hypothetical protein [Asanoa sp. WMMD1127]